MEQLFTIEQTARQLQLDKSTIRRQIKRGALRAIKRGGQWRVPESALLESSSDYDKDAEAIWRAMTGDDRLQRNQALRQLFSAPAAVRSLIMERSSAAAASFYAANEAELADWRALDGEPFQDDAGDYYTAEEEAEFRAGKTKAQS